MDWADGAEPPPDGPPKWRRKLRPLDLEIPDDNAIDLVSAVRWLCMVFLWSFFSCHVIVLIIIFDEHTIMPSFQIINHNIKPSRALLAVGICSKTERSRVTAIYARVQRCRDRETEEVSNSLLSLVDEAQAKSPPDVPPDARTPSSCTPSPTCRRPPPSPPPPPAHRRRRRGEARRCTRARRCSTS